MTWRESFSLLFLLGFIVTHSGHAVSYVFKEFAYKDTVANEKTWIEYENACGLTPSCQVMEGVDQVKCVRQCVSPTCYREIYQDDELEDGEIDVRLSSFKGCFIQRSQRHRHYN